MQQDFSFHILQIQSQIRLQMQKRQKLYEPITGISIIYPQVSQKGRKLNRFPRVLWLGKVFHSSFSVNSMYQLNNRL